VTGSDELGGDDESGGDTAGDTTASDRETTALHTPSHREALWELEAAFDRGAVVTVYGACTVEYDGRASASLGEGRRLLVLKPDGTALVHTDEGHEPANWQPPGSQHRAAVRDGRLRVRATRESPDERLDVQFLTVDHLVVYPVSGRRSAAVAGTEADLKRRVLAEPSLVAPGFEVATTERTTDAGDIDVFGHDGDGRPTVVELKRRRVGPDAVGQLRRYVDALRRASDDDDGDAVRGVLVAPSVTERAAELLDRAGFEHVAVDPPGGGTRSDDAERGE
jgi:RecB family endonuclease NucS